MTRLNRRQFIKTISFMGAGTAAVAVPFLQAKGDTRSLFLVTNQSRDDLKRLQKIFGEKSFSTARVVETPITSADQDLSLIKGGSLQDPVKNMKDNRIRVLAKEMRRRNQPGNVLVTVEFQHSRNSNFVEIERDGGIIERIPLQRDYSKINISGEYGETVFRLKDQMLSVTQAGCRHELCKKMGNITAGRIVCAPNKLVATVNGQAPVLDSITG